MLTYAPETNIAVTTSEELEPEFERVFFNLSEDEKCAKGKKILAGVSKCIPKLKTSQSDKCKAWHYPKLHGQRYNRFRFQSRKLGFVARSTCWRYLQEKLQWSGGTSARIYNQCMYEAIVLF